MRQETHFRVAIKIEMVGDYSAGLEQVVNQAVMNQPRTNRTDAVGKIGTTVLSGKSARSGCRYGKNPYLVANSGFYLQSISDS